MPGFPLIKIRSNDGELVCRSCFVSGLHNALPELFLNDGEEQSQILHDLAYDDQRQSSVAVFSRQPHCAQSWTVGIRRGLGSEPSWAELRCVLAQEQLRVCRFDPYSLNSTTSRASAGLWPRQSQLLASL